MSITGGKANILFSTRKICEELSEPVRQWLELVHHRSNGSAPGQELHFLSGSWTQLRLNCSWSFVETDLLSRETYLLVGMSKKFCSTVML